MRRFGLFWICVLLLSGQGCSTTRIIPAPVVNVRHGFLDRLNKSVPLTREEKRQVNYTPTQYSEGNSGNSTSSSSDFHWPLRAVEVTSPYGKRGNEFHDGIDLRAHFGTPVFASQSGVVLYADSKIRGYGKMVVLRHWGRVATIYAHNSKLLVKRGQRVKQGQQISVSGKSGHVRGPHLHFEIRQGVGSTDPIGYLPRPSRQLAGGPARLATAK